ncbi:hypothetical protein E2C01_002072 [Portunus trituberculatus]|uniref:Uncharacterized protein n=1 Tax=Portunus trituberculatus TaxID=210409 RepID=A0A5B7CJF1_PORTR|nr:hypothetical protein [Portunus trituberculatus]
MLVCPSSLYQAMEAHTSRCDPWRPWLTGSHWRMASPSTSISSRWI